MKTLNEITNGYQSIFERMSITTVASRLEAAACCGDETEDDRYKEFCDCVHCILCGYVVSGSFIAAEIPCDVSILHWVNAQSYVINWFKDYNDPDDDFDSDDDFDLTEDMMYEDGSSYFTTKDMRTEAMYSEIKHTQMKGSNTLMNTNTDTDLEQLKACIGDYVPHPYSAAYLEMVSSGDYVLDDEYDYGACYIETTEDMMYPDCSTHFTTKDMEAEYAHTDDYTKDTEVPDYSTKQLNATQYKAELIETMAASCTELNWFQISELIDQLSDMSDYYANI